MVDIALSQPFRQPSMAADHKFELGDNENIRRSACTPGTRALLLHDIIGWAEDISPNSPAVNWLFGPAGSGKTTIATLGRHLLDLTRRLPTNREFDLRGLFFDRAGPSWGTLKTFPSPKFRLVPARPSS